MTEQGMATIRSREREFALRDAQRAQLAKIEADRAAKLARMGYRGPLPAIDASEDGATRVSLEAALAAGAVDVPKWRAPTPGGGGASAAAGSGSGEEAGLSLRERVLGPHSYEP
jgi:hypothetical protein